MYYPFSPLSEEGPQFYDHPSITVTYRNTLLNICLLSLFGSKIVKHRDQIEILNHLEVQIKHIVSFVQTHAGGFPFSSESLVRYVPNGSLF